MGNDDYLTDDYVADLLAKDAKDCSLKFSTMGMEAFTSSSKKPVNAPKPNTRFLRHIIKDTDTHNKRLLDKEGAESKARLQDLERSEEAKRLKTNPNTGDIRRRQMGDIHAILGGKRPKKSREDSGSKNKAETSERRSRPNRDDRTPKKAEDNDLFASRDRRKHHGRLADDGDADASSKPSRHRSRRHSGSEVGDEDRSSNRKHRRSDKDRSRSPRRRRRSRSPDRKSRKHRDRSPMRSKHTPPPTSAAADEDSDPLDSIIGPQPAPQPRGRGALAGTSGIDRRFSETYDPTQDVSMEDHAPEGGDWDDEVEAFRDRQKLKQAQEQRLRLAGFNDEDINRTTSGGESAEDNVQWSKVGEKREWDMGKAT